MVKTMFDNFCVFVFRWPLDADVSEGVNEFYEQKKVTKEHVVPPSKPKEEEVNKASVREDKGSKAEEKASKPPEKTWAYAN